MNLDGPFADIMQTPDCVVLQGEHLRRQETDVMRDTWPL